MSLILVVEDNDLNRRLFVDLLNTRKHDVLEAADGSSALEQIRKKQPDLVLMDIQLPSISGLEITQKVRKMDNIKQPKIIAVSAFALKQDADKAIQAGCDDYLTKPISIATFFATIEKNLNS